MAKRHQAQDEGVVVGRRLEVDDLVAFMSLPIFYELRTAVDVGILLFDDLDRFKLPEGIRRRTFGASSSPFASRPPCSLPEIRSARPTCGW